MSQENGKPCKEQSPLELGNLAAFAHFSVQKKQAQRDERAENGIESKVSVWSLFSTETERI